jgi:uncharacterized repeat protein (TIGR03843 family)
MKLSSPRPVLEILECGEVRLHGQFIWGSNYTFLCDVTHAGRSLQAVYKPAEGERPLWDFPDGTLAGREVAAYHVAAALGWDFVPPTVLRQQAPAGPGSLQLFVEVDPEKHYFSLTEAEKELLRPAALFDSLINNADRKGGHIMLGKDGRLWLIDHGLCFHEDEKLRTVIWDFVGEEIDASLLQDLRGLRSRLSPGAELEEQLRPTLTNEEIESLRRRLVRLLELGRFPEPGPGRPYPWPLI